MTLNKRQLQIIDDLTNTSELLTAKYLANKYGVSLRTIRNDVMAIQEYLKSLNVEFVRKHGVGMKIISNNNIQQNLTDVNICCSDFIYYDQIYRKMLLIIYFIMGKSPISAQDLANKFLVSKGTILNEINKGLDFSDDLEIKGIKNKGFVIKADIIKQLSTINKISNAFGKKKIENILFNKANKFVSDWTCEIINSCCDYISNNLYLTIMDYSGLRIGMAFLISKMLSNKDVIAYKKTNSSSILGRFQLYFEHISGFRFNQIYFETAKYILNQYTDYVNDDYNDYTKIEFAVDEWIESMALNYPIILEEKDGLHIDLVKHIKSQINSTSFNIQNGNPLLQQIRERYGKVFDEVKITSRVFSDATNLYFNDDEIGYITLYFCKVLDKMDRIRNSRIMVVCNTGRGASKFLATRIMNNCPEVHIVAMSSYIDLEKDRSILKNIDMIISTINLPMVNVPYIVISPLITDLELAKIKEAVWFNQRRKTDLRNYDINSSAEYAAETITNYKKGKQFDDSTNIQNNKVQYNLETVTLFSTIEIEIAELIIKLLPNGIDANQSGILTGLRVHVLMAIPRWNHKEFVKIGNLKEIIEKYNNEYQIVMNFLKKMSIILQIEISEAEVTSIMEYVKLLKA